MPLLPESPAAPAEAIYDRTPDGLTLVSILPGGGVPSTDSYYRGASKDGSVVLFANDNNLYARVNGNSTLLVSSGTNDTNPAVGGVTPDGSAILYMKDGDLYKFDVASEVAEPITSSGDADFAAASQDASHVFFISPSQLDGSNGTAGQPNLYVWDGTTMRFIETVPSSEVADTIGLYSARINNWSAGVKGRDASGPYQITPGSAIATGGIEGNVRSLIQVTPDGSAALIQTKVELSSYDNGGHTEIYRYETATGATECVSCSPSGDPATQGAEFSIRNEPPQSTGQRSVLNNLSADGHTAFFESLDDLVPADHDGKRDVYEWHDGELSLISGGNSQIDDYFMGATPDGSNVMFRSADGLIQDAQDPGVPAIYDARVNGGFPASQTKPDCQGDACQNDPTSPPPDTNPGSHHTQPGNVVVNTKHCNKLEHKADKAKAKAHKFHKKAKQVHSKHRRKVLRQKAGKQKQRAKRLNQKASVCWKGGSK